MLFLHFQHQEHLLQRPGSAQALFGPAVADFAAPALGGVRHAPKKTGPRRQKSADHGTPAVRKLLTSPACAGRSKNFPKATRASRRFSGFAKFPFPESPAPLLCPSACSCKTRKAFHKRKPCLVEEQSLLSNSPRLS